MSLEHLTLNQSYGFHPCEFIEMGNSVLIDCESRNIHQKHIFDVSKHKNKLVKGIEKYSIISADYVRPILAFYSLYNTLVFCFLWTYYVFQGVMFHGA